MGNEMVLIIDNNDSFTFNLVDLFHQLNVSVEVISIKEITLETIEKYSHILISPGPDLPKAYPFLFEMLEVYAYQKIILGVCLGFQILVEFFGGSLFNLNRVRHGESKTVTKIKQSLLFQDIPSNFNVGLYHSWAVLQNSLINTPLNVIAICEDNIVMAIEHKSLPIYGVQFHPESFMTDSGMKILQNWLSIK